MSVFSDFIGYFKASKAEFKQVNWPTRKETIRFTIIVIAVSLGTAAFLGGLDYLFNFLIRIFILQ